MVRRSQRCRLFLRRSAFLPVVLSVVAVMLLVSAPSDARLRRPDPMPPEPSWPDEFEKRLNGGPVARPPAAISHSDPVVAYAEFALRTLVRWAQSIGESCRDSAGP